MTANRTDSTISPPGSPAPAGSADARGDDPSHVAGPLHVLLLGALGVVYGDIGTSRSTR